MNQFPEDIIPAYPLEMSQQFKTLISSFETGREARRQIWTFPKRSANLKWDVLTSAQVDQLWAFYNQQKGSYEPFYFFDLFSGSHTGEYVGRGNGSTTIFELPSKNTQITNFLPNGEFEHWSAGTSSPPDTWSIGGSGATVVRDTDVKEGVYSAALTYGGVASSYLSYVVPDPGNYAGTTVSVGCWMKTSASSAYIQLNDGVGSTYGYYSGGGAWQWVSLTRNIDPGSTSLIVYLIINSTGTVLLDAATLAKKATVSDADCIPTLEVFVNGVLTKVTLLPGTGDAGSDRIQFAAAPTNGGMITTDFTGQQRFRMRFQTDEMKKELFKFMLYSTGLPITEVRI